MVARADGETSKIVMIRVALVGFGYWGPNLARVISSVDGLDLTWIVDRDRSRRDEAAWSYPSVRIGDSLDAEVLAECDVVAVATPPGSHAEIAEVALREKKHLFVEKPFTLSSSDATRLLNLANDAGVEVQVDYTYLFTPEVQFLKGLYSSGELGKLNYLDSVRVNLGLVQMGANVIWDLAVHDFAILDYLFALKPVTVSASGAHHPDLDVLSAAFIVVKYEGGLTAHLHASWLSPVKVRRIMLSGTARTAIFDDVEADLKIKIYDSAVVLQPDQNTLNKYLVSYRLGDVSIPRLDRWEPLRREWEEFSSRIAGARDRISPQVDPVVILRLAESADESIKRKGCEVPLV